MSLAPITLTTDKSTAVIDDAHRKLRQDESGLSITVTVLNEDNTAYDLTGKNLVFCENKQGNKVIVDDGKGDNSGKFNRNSDNDTKGIFNYVLQEDVYAASGMAWFEINDGTTVDSTKNFYLDVERDASVSLSNNDYIGSLKALETAMAGAQNKVTGDLADMEAQITKQIADTKTTSESEITQAVKKLTDQTTAALSNVDEYTQKLNTLQSQWDSELQSIKTKASTDTDSAVKAINDKYTNDFASLQSNFTNWQTSTTQNYQKQVDAILAQVQGDGTEVANLQKQVDATAAKMQDLNKQFSSVDFTQFLKPSALDNYYTKSEVDGKLTTVGAVKTVDKIQPDSSGNVDLQPEFNSLLGRNNLLTDDEMDISKATKTDPAQKAISNAKYANGINTFHYCGVTDYERVNWKIAVQPNTNYELNIIANSTNQLTPLDPTNEPYIPFNANSSADLTDASNGDLGTCHLMLPWQGIETAKMLFNSKNYSEIYITCNFGFAADGVNTDITLQTTLLKSDSIQSQIDNLQNQTSTKANSSDVSALQNTVNSKVNVDGPLYKDLKQFNNWSDLFDDYVHSRLTAAVGRLVAFRDDTNGGNTVGGNSSGIAFGGGDTSGVLSVNYEWNKAKITAGNGDKPVWSEDIAWKSDITNLQNTIQANKTDVTNLQNTINQQSQTIQSLTTRLTNVENEISYIKANYIEGKQFPASQEAKAVAWENANPQGIAFITSN